MLRFLLTVLLTVVCLALVTPLAFGHPPSKVEAFYDFEQETLMVTVVHPVSNPRHHYVALVEVIHNEESIAALNFSQQENATLQRVEFQISGLESGDIIEVVARCSMHGQISTTIELR